VKRLASLLDAHIKSALTMRLALPAAVLSADGVAAPGRLA
jgi:hypothetical protein